MNLTERYKTEIDAFFKGADIDPYPEGKGHVWICEHRQRSFDADKTMYLTKRIETLTVEPPEGGQFELAVRVPRCDEKTGSDKYSGYIAGEGYLMGRNTGGH